MDEPPIDVPASANTRTYPCNRCGRVLAAANLNGVRIQFVEVGGTKQIRSRTTEYVCIVPQDDGTPSCRDLHPAWTQEPYSTPGFQHAKN